MADLLSVSPRPRRVAVVGSGVAGLTAAHVLRSGGTHVTLYEAASRLGGHADTHLVDVAGRTVAVDTGFLVHNDRTYPTLLRLFAELGVETRASEMSMSMRFDGSERERGIEYAGALGLRRLFLGRQPPISGVPADAVGGQAFSSPGDRLARES